MARFFNKDITPYCKYCARGRLTIDGDEVICPRKGVISADSSCKKFVYDPLKRTPSRAKINTDFTPEDFKL